MSSVAFSADGGTLAIGTQARRAYLWNIRSGQHVALAAPAGPSDSMITSVAFSENGALVAASNSAGRTSRGLRRAVSSVAFSPDGTTLATSDTDGSAYLWRISR
jgi:WD40 repeat protein